jgi:hypothetical protein
MKEIAAARVIVIMYEICVVVSSAVTKTVIVLAPTASASPVDAEPEFMVAKEPVPTFA